MATGSRLLPHDLEELQLRGVGAVDLVALELKKWRACTLACKPIQKVFDACLHHPRIVWIEKMISKQEAIQLYSNCRVFCCPSIYEPFGIINLEAMACRAPVVASATGGIKEVVIDGETGCLVPFVQDPVTSFPTDPKKFARDLAAAINRLIEDPEKCRRRRSGHQQLPLPNEHLVSRRLSTYLRISSPARQETAFTIFRDSKIASLHFYSRSLATCRQMATP